MKTSKLFPTLLLQSKHLSVTVRAGDMVLVISDLGLVNKTVAGLVAQLMMNTLFEEQCLAPALVAVQPATLLRVFEKI